VKLDFFEFGGQTFWQKLSKIAVLKGKSGVVRKIRKSTTSCSPHDHDWQQRAFLVGKEPQQFLHFEGDVFPEIEGDSLNVNGIGKPYAVQCGFS